VHGVVADSSTKGVAWTAIRIVGGNRLNGTIAISGAKNAALPLMIAEPSQRRDADAGKRAAAGRTSALLMKRILGNHGVDCMVQGKRPGQTGITGEVLELSAKAIVDTTAPYDSSRACARASG